jgi:hydrogenase maturation protease
VRDATPGSDGPGDPAGAVLVIGYGNALRSDDGVGWHAAALLADDPRLAGVEVLARHQLAPELALDMSRASLVILVDADAEIPPGAITVRRLEAAGPGPAAGGSGGGPGASSHHVGPAELLAVCRELYGAAPEAIVIGVGTLTMEVGESLSAPVAAALPAVADAVAGLVAGNQWSGGAPHR